MPYLTLNPAIAALKKACSEGSPIMAITENDLFNCWEDGKSPTPEQLENYDALEIHPMKDNASEMDEIEDDSTYFEACEPDEAEIWTVFLHYREGGIEALTDCDTKEMALSVAGVLSKRWNLPIN